MYQLLGHGLTPESARCTADALTIICKQLVSGRLPGRSLPPSLTSMQLGAFTSLLTIVHEWSRTPC